MTLRLSHILFTACLLLAGNANVFAAASLLYDDMPALCVYVEEYVDEVADLARTLETRMGQLPSRGFEQMLHPVFQEDEITLIIVGGLLGMGVGFLQTVLQAVAMPDSA